MNKLEKILSGINGPKLQPGDKVKFAPTYPDDGYFGKEKKSGQVFTVDHVQKNDEKKMNEKGNDVIDGGRLYVKLKEIGETHLLKSDDFVKVKAEYPAISKVLSSFFDTNLIESADEAKNDWVKSALLDHLGRMLIEKQNKVTNTPPEKEERAEYENQVQEVQAWLDKVKGLS